MDAHAAREDCPDSVEMMEKRSKVSGNGLAILCANKLGAMGLPQAMGELLDGMVDMILLEVGHVHGRVSWLCP